MLERCDAQRVHVEIDRAREHRGNRARREFNVGVREENPLAASCTKALLHRPNLTGPTFGKWLSAYNADPGVAFGKPRCDRRRCVGRAIVDDDQLEVEALLRGQRLDRALDRPLLVPSTKDDRAKWERPRRVDRRKLEPRSLDPRAGGSQSQEVEGA